MGRAAAGVGAASGTTLVGLLLLAQEKLQQAEEGVELIKDINDGGVPIISLIVAVICGAFAYWQLRRNNKLQEDQLADQKRSAAEREKAQAEAAKTRMAEQEALLREMLDRDREAQEGQMATAKALESLTEVNRDLRKVLEDQRRMLDDILRRMDAMERKLPS